MLCCRQCGARDAGRRGPWTGHLGRALCWGLGTSCPHLLVSGDPNATGEPVFPHQSHSRDFSPVLRCGAQAAGATQMPPAQGPLTRGLLSNEGLSGVFVIIVHGGAC